MGVKELVQGGHKGSGAGFHGRTNHTGEGCVSLGSAIILGVLASVAGNHDESQRPFGPVVGRLHFRLMQEAQQIAPVVVDADAIQRSLIVVVAESAVPEVMGDLGVQPLNLLRIVRRFPLVKGLP